MLKTLLLLPLRAITFVIGKLTWVAPPWLSWLLCFINKHRLACFGGLLVCLVAIAGWQYVDSLPKPIQVKAQLRPIKQTATHRDAKPDRLNIEFVYDFESLNEDQARPEGLPSVARIDLVGQEVINGIALSPVKAGKWTWLDDRRLEFIAETDWPAGTKYTVTFDKTVFASNAKLAETRYDVSTPELSVNVHSIELYQDPVDISVRRVVATLKASHPIDKASFEKSLSMSMQAKEFNDKSSEQPHSVKVTYSTNLREAYVQSEAVTLPDQASYMHLRLAKGVRSVLAGEPTDEASKAKVLIPDVYSFLKVSQSSLAIVRNQKNDPEQVLLLEFTDDIEQSHLLDKLALFELPTKINNQSKRWRNAGEVKPEVLAKSKKVPLTLIPNPRGTSKAYSFVVNVPEDAALYLKIDENFRSINKFVHASSYQNLLYGPRYPKEVALSGEGSILTFSGNRKLTVSTRSVDALRYTVGKLLPGKINHIVTQTQGDISNPIFQNWNFNEQDIVEYGRSVVSLQDAHPKQLNYSSFDLSTYLPEQNDRFGLFFVNVAGWDKERSRELSGVSDKRLILVTDLGVIVKNNADRTHDVFVQSIANGEPVNGASVELLGRNGLPLQTVVTDQRGHAFFNDTSGHKDEKQPAVYVVKTVQDMSFIPFNRSSRQINLSKFDIGGVKSNDSRNVSLNGFMFSDRGIYRPGESAQLGIIVKNEDLSNVENIPLQLVIYGPRSNELKVTKFNLSEFGFDDVQFDTEVTSDTGQYTASLHLVGKRGQRGRQISSTSFKVEEFQPDTMRIESRIEETSSKGWTTADSLTSTVSLMNLFGVPAQDRKTSARLVIQPTQFQFSEYQGFAFSGVDTQQTPLSLNTSLPVQRTDADGVAKYQMDTSKFDNGIYRLNFYVEGFDQAGGRSVSASNSVLISPLESIIGYKADGDLRFINAGSERRIEFINIDKTLVRQSAEKLILKLIQIQRISTLVKQPNGTYKYQTIAKEVDVSESALSISEMGYQHVIDTEEPGDFAVEVLDETGRRLSRASYTVAGFANLDGKLDKNAELQLSLEKQDYFPGDTIRMSIKAPYAGAGLISIESDKVHHFKWFKTAQESTVQEIVLPENLEGSAYINVAFIRDAGSNEIFTSPLSYAVQPFSIDKSKRTVDIELGVDKIVRPGKPMTIKFSTSKPSKIAVFAINEGILQVAKYSTPDPLAHFLKKKALNVQTMQILDLILPDFALVKQLSASGGGSGARNALAKNLNPFARRTDKPAVYWSGIYDASELEKTITYEVPNTFSGELRVMAVAVAEEALGATSESTVVRGPFVISPNVLTSVAPGDEFEVVVGVANIIEGSGKGAPVSIGVTATEHLEVIGASSGELLIDEGGEASFTFRVKAKEILGAADLTFTARYKDESLKRSAGLSVRPVTQYYTEFNGGYSKSHSVQLPLKRRVYQALSEQRIAASASPLVVIEGLTSYLDTYPHGCTEQIVSKVFPVIGLLSHPEYAAHLPNVQENFTYLIDKLRERQVSDGGFMFWPGSSRSSEYPSIYVMHFLIDANELGYPVPNDMLQRGKDYLTAYVQKSSADLNTQRDRANAIYLLTRLGTVTSNYLIDLEESLSEQADAQWRSDITSVYMAATYKLLQKDREAQRLLSGYKFDSKSIKTDLYSDFHSSLALDAQYVYLLSKHFESRARSIDGDLILSLTDKIYRGEYNTISSAYSILALGAYSKLVLSGSSLDEENITFESINAAKQKTVLNALATPFLAANYGVDSEALTLSSDKPMFYLQTQSGFDRQPPEQAIKEGIEIYRDFVDEQGQVVTTMGQGKEVTARLRVRALNGKNLSNIAIVDLLPGGFEVVRSSVSRTAYGWRADYTDVREDRVVYYGSFGSEVTELSYKVKLTAAGEFVVPASSAESMYDRSVRATTTAGRFIVTASN